MIYVAFLRAINVGGHVVTMENLRALFSKAGFKGVETFIASGNVIFESKAAADRTLEEKIEKFLEKQLGYTVATFVRSIEEIRTLSEYKPFEADAMGKALSYNIGFILRPLTSDETKTVMALGSVLDDFHIHGRELFWLSRQKQSETKLTSKVFERAINGPISFRNVNTIARIAAKYGG
jgi:uncharacterized protein (DUF1697 family)